MRTYEGGVKLIDLGQSCRLGTIKERIQGTADYIAPEQIDLGPITQRTDVYNLGATMFWCLTNQPVRSLLKSKGRQDVGTRIDEPRKPKHRHTDPCFFVPDLPGALSSLASDCLEKEPQRRPPDMRQVCARLDIALYQLDNTEEAIRRDREGSGDRAAQV